MPRTLKMLMFYRGKFIIIELDEKTLFIKPDKVEFVKDKVSCVCCLLLVTLEFERVLRGAAAAAGALFIKPDKVEFVKDKVRLHLSYGTGLIAFITQNRSRVHP